MEHSEVEMEKMKILFVATAFPRHKGDVITPWMVELVERLSQKGIELSVFTSSYKGLGTQMWNSIPIYRFRYFLKRYEKLTHEETAVDRFGKGGLNVLLSIFYIIFGTVSIIRLVRKKRFDIIHINWPFPHIIFGIAAKAFGRCRLFATFYGLEIRWLKKKFSYLIKPFSFLINRADAITAISNHTAGELKGIVQKKITIIPFSITIDSHKGEITEEKNEILFVGRLVERKGVNILIEAFNLVHNEIPHNLIIIGDGPQRHNWEEMSKRYGLETRVRFMGLVSKSELERFYQNCSFFVLPATYDRHGDTEGLGVVLIEAMSYSKPVIASNVGGIPDVVIDNSNGILVPHNDPEALAKAIKILAKDKILYKRLSINAKKTIDERFNWDKIIIRLIDLYEGYH